MCVLLQMFLASHIRPLSLGRGASKDVIPPCKLAFTQQIGAFGLDASPVVGAKICGHMKDKLKEPAW